MTRFLRLCAGITLVFFLSGCSALEWWRGEEIGQQTALAVLHVNDTHGRLEAVPVAIELAGRRTTLEAGGYARLATRVREARRLFPASLLLHGGDVMQGTLYFTKYRGAADAALMNRIGFDAMVTGNHEYDKGPGVLAGFLDMVNFPAVAANINTDFEESLRGKIPPFIIKDLGGRRIGIFGLVTPDTREISQPGPDMYFLDPIDSAQRVVAELDRQGVTKIIALTHLGYEKDMELARQVDGIDVIVGGHTHTPLGDFVFLNLAAEGPYPTRITGPSGHDVCVVQAWKWAEILGELEVWFDDDGHVMKCTGNPILLAGSHFTRKEGEFQVTATVTGDERKDILDFIDQNPNIAVVEEDPGILDILAPYRQGIAEMRKEAVCTVSESIRHVRIPGARHPQSGQLLESGSEVARLVAETMLWKAAEAGMEVDLALIQGGGVRADIEDGVLTVGQVLEMLPFENTLVTVELTGEKIRDMVETAVARAEDQARSGSFPYLAGARFGTDMTLPAGKRVSGISLDKGGELIPLDATATYRLITTSYLANGGDGYAVFAENSGSRRDTGLGDAEVFIEYARALGTVNRPRSSAVEFVPR